jgi:hypothetical protein
MLKVNRFVVDEFYPRLFFLQIQTMFQFDIGSEIIDDIHIQHVMVELFASLHVCHSNQRSFI